MDGGDQVDEDNVGDGVERGDQRAEYGWGQ